MALPASIQRYRTQIDIEISGLLDGFRLPLYDMLRYHLGYLDAQGNPSTHSHGKALRATLCLLAFEAFRGEYRPALPAAAAIELVHNFSLIHDDVQDGDRERRHRPTLWAIYGQAQAINAGMAMRVLANLSMMRLSKLGISPNKLINALTLVDQISLRLIEGQSLDLDFEERRDIGIEDYLFMVKLKTVSLISGALEMGAMLATDDPFLVQPLVNYGTNLGYAFQLRDDVLGIWGDRSVTGKPVGGDILRRKKTFPVVFAWQNASDRDRTILAGVYQESQIDANGQARVLEILESACAKKHTQDLIDKYCQEALLELQCAQLLGDSRNGFIDLIDFLTYREF